MIHGIGLDLVHIDRFISWGKKPYLQLLRIYNNQELEHCFSAKNKQAERLAGIFCAKEAFYKALTPLSRTKAPFLTVCKSITVISRPFVTLLINWKALSLYLLDLRYNFIVHSTISHTRSVASAVVIIEECMMSREVLHHRFDSR